MAIPGTETPPQWHHRVELRAGFWAPSCQQVPDQRLQCTRFLPSYTAPRDGPLAVPAMPCPGRTELDTGQRARTGRAMPREGPQKGGATG
jgi:hypothetical protein